MTAGKERNMSEMSEKDRLLVDYHDQIIKQRERHHEEIMSVLRAGLERLEKLENPPQNLWPKQ
jgi:hypothetical protein